MPADKYLLLQAAFASSAQAERARRLWEDSVPIDDIDAASQRALPQLHANSPANSPAGSRVQGLYRRAWYSNTLLLEEVKPLFDRLSDNRVRALANKQTAAVVQARACLPLDRFHLLVGDRNLEKTITTLRDTGWASQRPSWLAEAALRGMNFQRNGFSIQLCCAPVIDSDFWNRVQRIESGTDVFEVPGHADRMLEAAAPKYTWHTTSMYQRLLETLIVIQYGRQEPDWAALARISAKAGSTLPLADALEYLERDFGIAVPDGYLATLRGALVTPEQARDYRLKRGSPSLWRRIRLSGLEYRHLKRLSIEQNEPVSLVDYLKLRWNVTDVRGIARHAATIMTRPNRDFP